jgi:cell division ATPase FtsA
MHGAPAGGLPELVLAAIDDVVAAEGGETPEERRKLRGELLGRVVLSGGTSAMAGLPTRMENELKRTLKKESGMISMPEVKVAPPRQGDLTTWFGASMLAGTSTFSEHWCVHAPTVEPPAQGTRASRIRRLLQAAAGYVGYDQAAGTFAEDDDEDDEDDDDAEEEESGEEESGEEVSEDDEAFHEAFLEAEEDEAFHEEEEEEGGGEAAQ